MNIRKILGLSAIGVLLAAAPAQAIIQLYPPGTAFSGGLSDANIIPWLNGEITTYNGANEPDLPFVTIGTVGVGGNVVNGTNPIELDVTGQTYLVIHWGGGTTGGVKNLAAYYLPPTSGMVEFVNPLSDPPQNGISFYRFYGGQPQVPEVASTFMLLGMGLLGLAGIRRQFRRA